MSRMNWNTTMRRPQMDAARTQTSMDRSLGLPSQLKQEILATEFIEASAALRWLVSKKKKKHLALVNEAIDRIKTGQHMTKEQKQVVSNILAKLRK